MRTVLSMMLLGLLALSSGCIIFSVHPLHTDDTAIFEPKLLGQWSDNDEGTWTFSQGQNNSYELIITDEDGRQGTFTAHLVRINETLFLDLFPSSLESNNNEFHEIHFLPVHTFAHVQQVEPTLLMAFPNADWLEEYTAAHPAALSYTKRDGAILLTAESKDMQQFWAAHVKTEGAFAETNELKKRANP